MGMGKSQRSAKERENVRWDYRCLHEMFIISPATYKIEYVIICPGNCVRLCCLYTHKILILMTLLLMNVLSDI